MSEIVRDSSGRVYELRPSRGTAFSTLHMALRAALERHYGIRSVIDNPANREAIARALVEVGWLEPTAASQQSFEHLQRELQGALSSGTLQVVPYVRELRPLCEVEKIFEAEPLVSGPVTELSAANEPIRNEPPPWPGDAAAQADVLIRASESASPFCEVCEKARRSA